MKSDKHIHMHSRVRIPGPNATRPWTGSVAGLRMPDARIFRCGECAHATRQRADHVTGEDLPDPGLLVAVDLCRFENP